MPAYLANLGVRIMTVAALRLGILLVVAAVFTAFSAGQASANARLCAQLERELSSLSSGGNSSRYRAYADAARRQQAEISKAQSRYQNRNCTRLSGGQCASLRSAIRKMEGNLAMLERKRDAFAGASRNTSRARAIRARLSSLDCSATGNRSKTVVTSRKTDNQPSNRINVPQALGEYRTVCVRTCDGYYFPVSHASGERDFKRDEAICNALCPATETRLFVHRNADQESEDMVSLEGEPYTALPTAFKYRLSSRNPSCTCGAADPQAAGLTTGEEAKAGTDAKDETLAVLPVPRLRPGIYDDPETAMNAAQSLSPETIRQITGSVRVGEIVAKAPERTVRVVGPQFLPDPEEAIDLQAPAPTTVR